MKRLINEATGWILTDTQRQIFEDTQEECKQIREEFDEKWDSYETTELLIPQMDQ